MATDPAFALQGALVVALKALNTAAGTRVYDTVPRDQTTGAVTATFPYISVGEGQAIPVDEECFDRTEMFHQLDVWSRAVGYPEVKAIADALRGLLHEGSLTIAGHTLDRMHIASTTFSREADGKTSRARIQLETQTSPAP